MTTTAVHRLVRWILPALAAAGLATGTTLAVTSPPASASNGHPARTFTLTGTALTLPHDGFVDVGGDGPSVGDVELIADTLTDASHRRVGIDRGTCTIVHISGPITDNPVGENSCIATIALDEGTLTIQAIEHFTRNAVDGAITGGTGRFAGASGSVRIVLSDDGSSSTWTLHLLG